MSNIINKAISLSKKLVLTVCYTIVCQFLACTSTMPSLDVDNQRQDNSIVLELAFYTNNTSPILYKDIIIKSPGLVINKNTGSSGKITAMLPKKSMNFQEVILEMSNSIGDKAYYRFLVDKPGQYHYKFNLDSYGSLKLLN